jgi:small-conductance mechanosensitive channel
MKEHINYEKIFAVAEKAITTPNVHWQSLLLTFCFIFSYVCYNLSKKFVFPIIITSALKKNSEFNRLITRYFLPLIYPLYAIICMSVALSVYSKFFAETVLFLTTLKLTALFVFLRFLRILSNNNFIPNIVGIFLVTTLALDILGLLDSTINYLDFYAFKIGSIRISIYLIIKGFVVLLAVFWLSTIVSKRSKSYVENSKTIKSSNKGILSKLIDIMVYAVAFVTLLKTLGVDMTTLAVIGGAVGVGIGFGLQKIASNFISGIILVFEKSVEIGDIVEIDNGNIFGTVKYFGGRYTLIESFDGKEIMIPNEDFIINKVGNWTYSNNRSRIEIQVGVAYGSDLALVKEILLNCAKENPLCLSYPEVDCFLTEFGDYDIKFILYFWINDIVRGRLGPKSEVLMSIWSRLKENNIEIPLPQREIRNK